MQRTIVGRSDFNDPFLRSLVDRFYDLFLRWSLANRNPTISLYDDRWLIEIQRYILTSRSLFYDRSPIGVQLYLLTIVGRLFWTISCYDRWPTGIQSSLFTMIVDQSFLMIPFNDRWPIRIERSLIAFVGRDRNLLIIFQEHSPIAFNSPSCDCRPIVFTIPFYDHRWSRAIQRSLFYGQWPIVVERYHFPIVGRSVLPIPGMFVYRPLLQSSLVDSNPTISFVRSFALTIPFLRSLPDRIF